MIWKNEKKVLPNNVGRLFFSYFGYLDLSQGLYRSNYVDTGIKLLQAYKKAFPKKRPAPSHPDFSCITDDYPEGQKSRCEMILRLAYHNITKEVVTSGTHFR